MIKNYITYPNQKEIVVHKPVYTGNFMSVGNDEWVEASQKLTYSGFKLYLYMASNCDKFQFALSKKAVQNKFGISDNTYTKAVKELQENNYLILNKGNLYDFYTVPQNFAETENGMEDITHCNDIPHSNVIIYPVEMGEYTPLECNNIHSSDGREISNKSNKNNLSNNANAKDADAKKESFDKSKNKKNKRTVNDLSVEEKAEIVAHYKTRDMEYPDMYKYYNLEFGCLNKDTMSKFEEEIRIVNKNKAEEEKKKVNLDALVSFGLTQSEGDELCGYLLDDCTWEMLGENASSIMKDFLGNINMSVKEVLVFLREHEYARRDMYNKNKNFPWEDRLIIDNQYRWEYYSKYLESYIANPEEIMSVVIEYEKKKELEEKKKREEKEREHKKVKSKWEALFYV